MKVPTLLATVPVLAMVSLMPPVLPARDTGNLPSIGEIIKLDPALDALLEPGTKIEVLASGFDWIEGPVWVPDEKHRFGGFLLFSDIPRNQVIRWDEGSGVSVYLEPSGYTGLGKYGGEPGSNGLLLDSQQQLVSCEHGDRRLSLLTKNGGKRTLLDNYGGKRLNSPNDACFHPSGDLYFTDPPYGLPKGYDDPRRELDFCGVFRFSKAGETTLLTKELTRPNGIAFSPDHKTLYVSQSDPKAAIWKSFPVEEDGTLGEGKLFYDATKAVTEKLPGLPDGMKVDRDGNLWATGPGGVHILTPESKLLGRISTGGRTSNCAWGNDGSALYITADMYLCRVKTKTRGAGWIKK